VNPIHPALASLARAAMRMPREDCAPFLKAALLHPAWLRAEHRVGDPTRYMRHVLYVDPQGAFVMTAITWLPGQVSPLHGHQVWCAFGVAEGELTEECFRQSGEKLEPLRTNLHRPGDVAERDFDCEAIHRVSNRSRATIVSLHLYGVSAERLTTGINRVFSA
jgi:predicted metal-dependent enzyme (double-stranded beta helix superfamily)